MRTSEPPSRSDLLDSLRCKLVTYAAYLRRRNPGSEKALRLEVEAAALFAGGQLPKLRAWSREVDVWIRETLEPSEQDGVATELKQAGVLREHLPQVWSVAAARRILKRGAIRNQTDLSVVRVTLDTEGHGHLSSEDLMHLGRLFDEFTLTQDNKASPTGKHAKA
jgi:hypothetical protein